MSRQLPAPTRTRWQPTRAGLVDLFYYDAEEFWFRDGRLLLRGNNGTGKSKVLALTLPFLLDADLSAHRVEPDGDKKKRMEWNLLLGGAHPYPERLGYTWLEFGRLDEHAGPQFYTIGCGLKAVSGRGVARHWFFTTDRRVGADLRLVDPTGTALSRDRLEEALGEHGTVHDRARSYRRAVDESLFGLGEQRYNALVDLLVQLRQPQLSKQPSEKALSGALTQALPPLDQAIVADVAEAFRSLEEDRSALRVMVEARDAATSFLAQYRRYARTAARRRAARPRNTQAAYERVNRDLTAVGVELRLAEESLAAAQTSLAELETERQRLRARDLVLRRDPTMDSARELEQAAKDAARLADAALQRVVERDRAADRMSRQEDRYAATARRVRSAAAAVDAERESGRSAAGDARLASAHAAQVDAPLSGQADLPALEGVAARLAERQETAAAHVRGLIEAAEDARRHLAAARARVAELDAEGSELAHRRADADEEVRLLGAELTASVADHLAAAAELRLPDQAATLAELALWVETLDGPNPATAAVGAAGQDAGRALAAVEAQLTAREQALRGRLAELGEEIAALEAGADSAPPAPHTRGSDRSGRPGAPLWKLVEFVDGVGPADQAGVESALEAAGILDAWVSPAGELLAADTLLRPQQPVATNLGSVLRPAIDPADPAAAAVPGSTVAALLAGIGFGGHGTTWVGPDGRFRVDVLSGAWHKPAPTYIGAAARAAARRARLSALRVERSAVESELTASAGALDRLAARRAALAAEVAGLPGDEALRTAHAAVLAVVREQDRLAGRMSAAREYASRAAAAARDAGIALHEAATDLDLPPDRPALDAVAAALVTYRISLARLWPAVQAHREAARRAEDDAADLEASRAAATEATARAMSAEHDAVTAHERHHTLDTTVGAAVADLQRRLAEVARDQARVEAATARTNADRDAAMTSRGKATGRLEELTALLHTTAADRAEATEAFRRFAATGLLAIALPELELPDPTTPWAPDPTVRLARRINDELAEVPDDDSAWDRAQHRVNDELKSLHDTLSRHGNRAAADLREEGMVVEIDFRGRSTSVPALVAALDTEVADRERLLNERERAVLENHLVNEVASTLQELISAAEAQVATMNAELEQRPTSTGMRLRLRWEPRPDGPAGVAPARDRLLRQTSDAWSERDRSAVGEFLQAQIAAARAGSPEGTWLEHLTTALDYRAWNHFVIERHQAGQWRPAAGPASGGERVLAASVPLFAAASAHYASATNPYAPRLVTLDEAFAGVDDNARARYLGLLAAFDLDVVMTSEREWGCYPEVPGLAIAQLSRTDEVAAVLVTNWEWDGHARTHVSRIPTAAESRDLMIQETLPG